MKSNFLQITMLFIIYMLGIYGIIITDGIIIGLNLYKIPETNLNFLQLVVSSLTILASVLTYNLLIEVMISRNDFKNLIYDKYVYKPLIKLTYFGVLITILTSITSKTLLDVVMVTQFILTIFNTILIIWKR